MSGDLQWLNIQTGLSTSESSAVLPLSWAMEILICHFIFLMFGVLVCNIIAIASASFLSCDEDKMRTVYRL